MHSNKYPEYSATNRYNREGLQIWDAETFECSQVLSASLGEVCSAQLGSFLCAADLTQHAVALCALCH